MEYIKRTAHGVSVAERGQTRTLKVGIRQFFGKMLLREHTTYEGRIQALKKRYGLKNNVPIYIDEDHCFYTTKNLREYDSVCINYHSVLSVREKSNKETEIVFKDLSILALPIPYATIMRKHAKTAQFLRTLSFS